MKTVAAASILGLAAVPVALMVVAAPAGPARADADSDYANAVVSVAPDWSGPGLRRVRCKFPWRRWRLLQLAP